MKSQSLAVRWLLAAVFVLIGWGLVQPAQAISLPEGYELPPVSGQAVPVDISLFVDEISRIDVANQTFMTTGQLVLKWTDSRVAKLFEAYPGVKAFEYEGAQAKEKLGRLWHPALTIFNEQGQRKTGVLSLQINRDGQIVLYEKFDSVPHLSGSMQLFPFATENLRMTFTASSQSTGELALKVDQFAFQNGADPDQVVIGKWDYVDRSFTESEIRRSDEVDRGYPRVDFFLTVRQDPVEGFITFILPILLIGVVSVALLFLDAAQNPSYSGPRVGGMLTLILTTVALEITLQKSLPAVHYSILPKLLLNLSIIMLTSSVIQSCWQIWLYHNGQVERSIRLDKVWRRLYPTVFVMLALCVWAYCALSVA